MKSLKKGLLLKQSDYWKSWNERVFELNDTCLSYFMAKEDPRPKLLIDLRKAHVSGVSTIAHASLGTIHQFCVTVDNTASAQMPPTVSYFLASPDADDAKDWVAAIRQVIAPAFTEALVHDSRVAQAESSRVRSQLALPTDAARLLAACRTAGAGWVLQP